MPMGVVPPQQTFSPVASSDGSPIHQMQQQQPGYGQPPMGPGQPQMYNQANAPPGYSQAGGQYQPQVTSQTGQQFQQGPYQQQPMSTQPSNLPGTYDSQAGYQTGGQYGQMPQSTMPQQGGIPQSTISQGMQPLGMPPQSGIPPSTIPQPGGMPSTAVPQQGIPQQGIPQSQGMPMSQGYQMPPNSNVDYQAFNMQGKYRLGLVHTFYIS